MPVRNSWMEQKCQFRWYIVKDRWQKSKNPILIYGYGAYGINVDPVFSSPRLSLLDTSFAQN